MQISPELIAEIISVILFVVSIFIGAKYRKFKGKVKALAGLINEVDAALEDDQVSKEETAKILEKAITLAEDP